MTSFLAHVEIQVHIIQCMVGPQDGGFGFDGAPKYSSLEGKSAICIQCQAGQHSKCLAKINQSTLCDCELCLV